MAEEQKPAEVSKVDIPSTTTTEQLNTETKTVENTKASAAIPAPAAPAADDANEASVAASTEVAMKAPTSAPAEEHKKEVAPVKQGTLERRGVNFPKNFIYTKEFFWFGTDAIESKNLCSYLKSEKQIETAQHNAAWASYTGKGLLLFGDKTAPQGVINLADASEPTSDGATKFHFVAKGHKHTFKAASAEERDNWISQLKLKITEAKELVSTVTETEAYKLALDSFKPTKKEEKKEEKATQFPATTEALLTNECPLAVENAAVPVASDEEALKDEESKREESKRRSASRKRASIFGTLLGKKEEKEETAATSAAEGAKEETPAVPGTEAAATEAAASPASATELPVAEATTEDKKEKPATVKRNSIFGVFGKKEKKLAAAPIVADAEASPPAAREGETPLPAEVAPVIPPFEATAPLAVDAVSPSTIPVETKETNPAPNNESRPDIKEKRKSSLPFGFGKRDKSPAQSDAEETEKPEKPSAFSKLRATIKGRGKTSEKPVEKLDKTDEKPEITPACDVSEPAAETPAAETPKATGQGPKNKPENVASSSPAPVTAAA